MKKWSKVEDVSFWAWHDSFRLHDRLMRIHHHLSRLFIKPYFSRILKIFRSQVSWRMVNFAFRRIIWPEVTFFSVKAKLRETSTYVGKCHRHYITMNTCAFRNWIYYVYGTIIKEGCVFPSGAVIWPGFRKGQSRDNYHPFEMLHHRASFTETKSAWIFQKNLLQWLTWGYIM